MPPNVPHQLADAFARHAPALLLYARQWLDSASAEDAVQEALIQLWRSRDVQDPRAWLFRTVRNTALNTIRSRQRRARRESAVATERATWFAADAEVGIDREEVQRALAELPDERREIVILRIWGGLKFAEISEITGRKVSTVHNQYQQALHGLRHLVEESCPKN